MHPAYEIFEILPDGSRHKVALVPGLQLAKARLDGLANCTVNECFASDAKTLQIVAHRNVPASQWRLRERIFQIAYNEQDARTKADLLIGLGYGVVSAFSNEAAKLLLSSHQHYDFFIVGYAAPERARNEMVEWLKDHYPNVKVLALNPPNQQVLSADYNAVRNGPENWLPFLAQRKTVS